MDGRVAREEGGERCGVAVGLAVEAYGYRRCPGPLLVRTRRTDERQHNRRNDEPAHTCTPWSPEVIESRHVLVEDQQRCVTYDLRRWLGDRAGVLQANDLLPVVAEL